MTLVYLAVATMVGIGLGQWLWQGGLLGCDQPPWLWWLPFLLLLFTPFLYRWERKRQIVSSPALRWPASAGFVPPPTSFSLTISITILLCLLMGALRMASVPQIGCWTEADLVTWNLPSAAAFTRDAPQVTAARPSYRYGQPITVTGRLATPPDFEDFSYRDYLARQGIHSHFYDAKVVVSDGLMQGAAWRRWLYDLRGRAMLLVERMLPEPHAALAEGILLGVDAGIPDALYERFNATGTSHVLVISGLNVHE